MGDNISSEEHLDKAIEIAIKLKVDNPQMNYIELRKELIDVGMEPRVAAVVAKEAFEKGTKKAKSNSNIKILIGLLALVGGLAGTYYGSGRVFYGAMIYGVVQLIWGLSSKF